MFNLAAATWSSYIYFFCNHPNTYLTHVPKHAHTQIYTHMHSTLMAPLSYHPPLISAAHEHTLRQSGLHQLTSCSWVKGCGNQETLILVQSLSLISYVTWSKSPTLELSFFGCKLNLRGRKDLMLWCRGLGCLPWSACGWGLSLCWLLPSSLNGFNGRKLYKDLQDPWAFQQSPGPRDTHLITWGGKIIKPWRMK